MNNPLVNIKPPGTENKEIVKEIGRTTYGVGFPLFDETVTKPFIKKTLEDSLKVVKNVTGLEGTTTVQFPITDISDGKKIVEGVANNFGFLNSLTKVTGAFHFPWALYKAIMAAYYKLSGKNPNLDTLDNGKKRKWFLNIVGALFGLSMYLREKLAIFYGALKEKMSILINRTKSVEDIISKVTSKVYSRIKTYSPKLPDWFPKINVSLPIDPYDIYVGFANPLAIVGISLVDFLSNYYLAKKSGKGGKESIKYAIKNTYAIKILDFLGSPIKLLTKLVYRKSNKFRDRVDESKTRYNNGTAGKLDKIIVYLAKYAKVGPYA